MQSLTSVFLCFLYDNLILSPAISSSYISKLYQLAIVEVAFHHSSVNGQKPVRARVMGPSRPNFSPKLEPIHMTIVAIVSSVSISCDRSMEQWVRLVRNTRVREGFGFYQVVCVRGSRPMLGEYIYFDLFDMFDIL